MKKLYWFLLFFSFLFIIILVVGFLILNGTIQLTSNKPILTENFVDLNDIKQISQFRSCQGHLVIPGYSSEPNSNMKHYFKHDIGKEIKVYAPFDGYITFIMEQTLDNEGEIGIGLLRLPPFGQWNFILEHINVDTSLKSGDKVIAGQLIGIASSKINSFDVVYAKMRLPTIKIDNYNSPYAELDSIFNYLDYNTTRDYVINGIASNDMIISIEDRLKNNCTYGNMPYFEYNYLQQQKEWISIK